MLNNLNQEVEILLVEELGSLELDQFSKFMKYYTILSVVTNVVSGSMMTEKLGRLLPREAFSDLTLFLK